MKCNDNKTYVGCTGNLKERLERHKKGYVPATKLRLPIKLIACFCFINKSTAFNFESFLKTGNGRGFMKRHKVWD